jgi:hypothetical protein
MDTRMPMRASQDRRKQYLRQLHVVDKLTLTHQQGTVFRPMHSLSDEGRSL